MIGFRTEEFAGEGYRDAAAVMAHETFTMQNSDIPEYLAKTLLKDTEWEEKLTAIASALNSGDTGSDDLYKFLDEAYEDPETGIRYFKELLNFIKTNTGNDIRYALWLCESTADIRSNYEYGSLKFSEFDTYKVSDIVLADLGREGKLYGYTTLPLPII